MTKPLVQHAACGGLITPLNGTIVCTKCQKEVPNQLEWIHERLTFKPARTFVALPIDLVQE